MHPRSRWASCGAMALTGDEDGPPLAPDSPAAAVAEGLAARFGLDARLLAERAALLGLRRRGAGSCGGATRLLEAADGWLALALPREEDRAALPALFGVEHVAGAAGGDPWPAVAGLVRGRPAAEVEEGATLLGLAGAAVGRSPARFAVRGTARDRTPPGAAAPAPWVLDLSGLWAGPLCGHLLGRAGATVVKVESTGRPDGARLGPPAFYDLLNGGKASVALDLGTAAGRAALAALVERSDVVVSSARARAVEQLGLDPDAFLAAGRDRVWVAVTGHGWDANRVGFGDDAAAAAGLVAWGPDDGRPRFAADAVADPLCGLMAAAAALDAWRAGGAWFVDASLAGAAAAVAGSGGAAVAAVPAPGGWAVDGEPVAPPTARAGPGPAAALGADTERVLAGIAR